MPSSAYILSAATATAAVSGASLATDPALYEQLLSNPHRTWEPVHPDQSHFKGWSNDQIRGLMGLSTRDLPGRTDDSAARFFARSVDEDPQIPDDFDARTQFSSCIGPIRDQAKCGSCWAFGASETLSDNLCVQGLHTGPLSAQDLVSCDPNDHGCNGGDLIDAWTRLTNVGIVDQACMPYTAENGTVAACPNYCTGSGAFTRHKCPSKYNMLEDEMTIKNGVWQMGAAETGFYVYSDFLTYQSGIYHHDNSTSNMPLGGHAVKIVGWGKSGETKYWLVANSWGTSWGMDGFFKIDMADRDSAFALGGAFNCGPLKPVPAQPTPAPQCKNILPDNECSSDAKDCQVRHLVCAKSCKCCGWISPPAYCNNE